MMNSIAQFYDEYVECWVHNPRNSVRKSYLSLLGNVKGKSVIDVGCGCGIDLAELKALGCNGIGLDISAQSLHIARKRIGTDSRMDLLCDDFFNYYPGQKFDIAVFSMVVMHYPNLNSVFNKLAQFLKPGGQLLLVTNNPYLVLLDYDLSYPQVGKSVAYSHKFVYNGKEITIEKYLHALSDYYNIAKSNGLVVDIFQEQTIYSDETRFFNPNPRNDIPNFITFLYRKS